MFWYPLHVNLAFPLTGKKAHVETVGERDFLRTEGDPAAVGYTINEAVALSRSMVCYFLLLFSVKMDFLVKFKG